MNFAHNLWRHFKNTYPASFKIKELPYFQWKKASPPEDFPFGGFERGGGHPPMFGATPLMERGVGGFCEKNAKISKNVNFFHQLGKTEGQTGSKTLSKSFWIFAISRIVFLDFLNFLDLLSGFFGSFGSGYLDFSDFFETFQNFRICFWIFGFYMGFFFGLSRYPL